MSGVKVMILGLDGATFRIVRPLVDAGKLPHLGRLMREGAWGVLQSIVPPHTAAAWPTFMTGKHPGKHGLFSFDQPSLGGYGGAARLVTSQAIAGQTIFDYAGRAGLRVAAVRVPMTYPAWPVNGVMISGYPSPESGSSYTYPRELSQTVPGMRDPAEARDPGERKQVLLEEIARTGAIGLQVLGEGAYDLFMLVFQQSDVAHHWYWRYIDKKSPVYSDEEAARYGDVIELCYRAIDEQVGKLLQFADDDTSVLVVSDHGGCVSAPNYFHINAWLRQEGLLALRRRSLQSRAYDQRHYLLPKHVRTRLKRIIAATMPEKISTRAEDFYFNLEDVNWAQTKAFRFNITAEVQGIMLNVAGRQPSGIVKPGAEFERLRDDVITRLHRLHVPGTNQPLVERIYKREELYGSYGEGRISDIIFSLHPDYRGGDGATGPIFAPLEHEELLGALAGWHDWEGILLANGPRFIHGGATLTGAALHQMAPTILRCLDIPIPDAMDGTALTALFNSTLATVPSRSGEETIAGEENAAFAIAGNGPAFELSDEEEESIKGRLRSLGYL
jgi:predicted AlkP superfamily phosphohydrolase/phosphomutase